MQGVKIHGLTEKILKKQIGTEIKALLRKYDDPQNKTALQQANDEIQETKSLMQNNLEIMMQNVEKVDEMDIKAERSLEVSKKMAKGSKDLASIMYWRNVKIVILIIIIVVAILLYFSLPFISKLKNSMSPSGGSTPAVNKTALFNSTVNETALL